MLPQAWPAQCSGKVLGHVRNVPRLGFNCMASRQKAAVRQPHLLELGLARQLNACLCSELSYSSS